MWAGEKYACTHHFVPLWLWQLTRTNWRYQFVSKYQTNKQFKFTSSTDSNLFQVHLKFQLSDFRKETNDSWSYCSHVFLYALSFARVLLCALSVPRGMSYRGLNMVFSTWRHAITILWKWKSTSNYELHKRSVGRNRSRNLKRGAIRMKRERGKREGSEGYGLLFFILKPSVENSLSHNIFILYHMYITHQFNVVQTFLTVSTRGNRLF